jgi:hypothetical protein
MGNLPILPNIAGNSSRPGFCGTHSQSRSDRHL